MLGEISHLIFHTFNEIHMAIMCVIVALLNLYLSYRVDFKRWPRRVKAFNWAALSLAFFVAYFAEEDVLVERSWFRLTFALLVIGEFAYYGDVIVDLVTLTLGKIKNIYAKTIS